MELKYILFILLLFVLSYYYNIFKTEDEKKNSKYYFKMIEQYLISPSSSSLAKNNKPFIWIHLQNDSISINETNAREWLNFYSRNTKNFNQPYQLLTIKSIIDHNSNDFNICLIDDASFKKIIPDWNINIESMANPLKSHIRSLAISILLNIYGGMIVPSSFICLKSFKNFYYETVNNKNMFVSEFENNSTFGQSFVEENLVPNVNFMGSNSNNEELCQFINYQQSLYSKDFTVESNFTGKISKWLAENKNKIKIVNGQIFGTKCIDNNLIVIDDLIDSKNLILNSKCLGVYVPWEHLLNRVSLSWFVYLSEDEVMKSNTNISKYLLLSKNNL